MKGNSLDSFESLSKQLLEMALKLSAAKDEEDGTADNRVAWNVRHKLIGMLDAVLGSLSLIFKS